MRVQWWWLEKALIVALGVLMFAGWLLLLLWAGIGGHADVGSAVP